MREEKDDLVSQYRRIGPLRQLSPERSGSTAEGFFYLHISNYALLTQAIAQVTAHSSWVSHFFPLPQIHGALLSFAICLDVSFFDTSDFACDIFFHRCVVHRGISGYPRLSAWRRTTL